MSKLALCVGINTYKHYPSARLNGCVNDAREMRNLLLGYQRFSGSAIRVITDQSATKANIVAELSAMVDEARKGYTEKLVFSLSSHGTQIPDRGRDESDRLDEAFCPYDLAEDARGFLPARLLVDDELAKLFARLPAEVELEVFLDTCHSGTGLRDFDPIGNPRISGRMRMRPRFLPNAAHRRAIIGAGRQPAASARRRIGTSKRHVLWSACRAEQTSADAFLGGNWHGAFTYYLCRIIRETGGNLPRAEVLRLVKHSLAEAGFAQVPELSYGGPTLERGERIASSSGSYVRVAPDSLPPV